MRPHGDGGDAPQRGTVVTKASLSHDLPAAYGNVRCEWHGCTADAVCLRDTPWGELATCVHHEHSCLGCGEQEPCACTEPARTTG
jgi:hypothetical protein